MAKKSTATRGKSKAAYKGKRKAVLLAGIAPVPGPPPTDIEITGVSFGYVAAGVGGATVVAFSAHFQISGTVSPAPVPPAQVSGYVYSMGQRYGAAATMTDAFGNWTLDFDLTGAVIGSDAQIKVFVNVPGDPASQIMGLSIFGFFDTGLFDELICRNGDQGR